MKIDKDLVPLIAGVFAFLSLATAFSLYLKSRKHDERKALTIQNLHARIKAWWGILAVFGGALLLGKVAVLVLFGLLSFWALREFITLAPTRLGDHRSLFWAFFIVTPLQYYLLAVEWYNLFVVLIPVYAFLFLATRNAMNGDCERFLERTAKIQWGLMICVYCVSHAPALLNLKIPGYDSENAKLLFWFVLVVEINDVLQYVWGKTMGKKKIAPKVSPNKTWEGFVGGTVSTVVIGALLYWITPFSFLYAAGLSLVIALGGFAGGLVMSAIKRDRGVKDFGASLAGHGGIMDRIDSLSFAAPLFFHLTRYFFT